MASSGSQSPTEPSGNANRMRPAISSGLGKVTPTKPSGPFGWIMPLPVEIDCMRSWATPREPVVNGSAPATGPRTEVATAAPTPTDAAVRNPRRVTDITAPDRRVRKATPYLSARPDATLRVCCDRIETIVTGVIHVKDEVQEASYAGAREDRSAHRHSGDVCGTVLSMGDCRARRSRPARQGAQVRAPSTEPTASALSASSAYARFTAETTARRDAVVMEPARPTPQKTRLPNCTST